MSFFTGNLTIFFSLWLQPLELCLLLAEDTDQKKQTFVELFYTKSYHFFSCLGAYCFSEAKTFCSAKKDKIRWRKKAALFFAPYQRMAEIDTDEGVKIPEPTYIASIKWSQTTARHHQANFPTDYDDIAHGLQVVKYCF